MVSRENKVMMMWLLKEVDLASWKYEESQGRFMGLGVVICSFKSWNFGMNDLMCSPQGRQRFGEAWKPI